jgi:Rieske 2Fe-2S family protein
VHLGIVLGFVTDHPPGVGDTPESTGVVGDAVEDVKRNPILVCYIRRFNRLAEELLHVALADVAGQLTNVALDGRLRNARLMGEGFDTDEYRLRSAHLRELAGLIFVCLSPDPPDFDAVLEAIEPQLRPHGLEKAKIVARDHYEVKANWKVIIENNRECYHCRVSHPEFCMSNYDLGLPGDPRGDEEYDATLRHEYERWRGLGLAPREVRFPNGSWYRVSRYPLKEGFLTESLDGRLVAPLLGDLIDPNAGSLRIITLPNLWAHANCDYAMTTRLIPSSPESTRIDVCFLVREDAAEGPDYDPERVAAVWRATSEQDWELCELNYAGIKFLAYEPGPLSKLTENSVEQFVRWYLDQLRRAGSTGYGSSTPECVLFRGDVERLALKPTRIETLYPA